MTVQAIPLRTATDTALANNPALQRTERAIQVAEQALKSARGQKGFSVTASGGFSASKYEGTSSDESLTARVGASLPLYTGNRLESQIRSAELEIDIAKFDYAQACDDLIYQVTTAYINSLENLATANVYIETENNLAEHEQNIAAQYDAGAKARIDYIRAQVETSNAEQDTAKSYADYEVSLVNLATLMAVDNISNLSVEDVATRSEFGEIEYYLNKADENRNDLKSSELKIEQGDVNIEIAKSGKRPTIAAEIASGLSAGTGDWHLSPSATAGVNASWNIFDSGVTRAEIQSAEIELERLQLALRNDINSVHEEVLTAYKNLRIALLRLKTTQRAVNLAEEERYIATEKYRAGEGILLDVLDAEVALTTAKKNHVSATYDVARYRFDLAHATGDTLSVLQ